MLLSKILIPSYIIIHYIAEENSFAVINYKLLVQKNIKSHVNKCFKINGKQNIMMSIKNEYVKFKNYERNMKLPFLIYVDFESNLVSKDYGNQNTAESYMKQISKTCYLQLWL